MITAPTYNKWQAAYDHYNAELFGGALPPCLITLHGKDHRSFGYFSPSRFGHMRDAARTTDEIALNPMKFKSDGVVEALQTLVHEMVHLWQQHHGTPSRGYHNGEWSAKMESIGLMPSNTGKPGGKKVGAKMADYMIPGGHFDTATRRLLASGWDIDWYDRIAELRMAALTSVATPHADGPEGNAAALKPNKTNRLRYDCPKCGARAWGKPDLQIKCGRDDTAMLPPG